MTLWGKLTRNVGKFDSSNLLAIFVQRLVEFVGWRLPGQCRNLALDVLVAHGTVAGRLEW